jgi:uncharacterized protein (DUF433 family)
MLARLDARARAIGATRTTLVEQFLEESLRLVEHPGIVFRDGPAGRRPAIAGRLDVWQVIETVRHNAGSLDAAAAYHAIPLHAVETAARYFAAYPDEIDAWIRSNDELEAREARLAAEQRRLLG